MSTLSQFFSSNGSVYGGAAGISSHMRIMVNTQAVSIPAGIKEVAYAAIGAGCSGSKCCGSIFGLGGTGSGHLGLNDTVSRSSPAQVGSLTNWYLASAGNIHSLAILNTDT
jgi:hypothetical protein